MASSRNYYIHLGFDWDSYTIGSVWGDGSTNTNRWLQYVISTNANGTSPSSWGPSLFQFKSGDKLYFRAWSLDTYAGDQTIVGYVGLNDLTGDNKYTSTNGPLASSSPQNIVWDGDHYVISPIDMAVSATTQSPWVRSGAYNNSTLGPLQATGSILSFKMSFKLVVTRGGETRTFNGDPESRIIEG